MEKARSSAVLFATLLLLWIFLNGSLAVDVLIVGTVVSVLIVLLFKSSLAAFSELKTTPQALRAALQYCVYFIKELIKANIRLARIVLSPSLPVKPGIVKVRTRLKSKMGRLLLANSITLTPGTLTVELKDEWLYVHWVSVESSDVEAATTSIVSGFEQYLEVMYG
ncbi:MAG: Na+/H+ antiporter subunit E [Chromatiales bacterium]|nr:Na+/H+ antiporter subunit E [Chromatiales bacterium]